MLCDAAQRGITSKWSCAERGSAAVRDELSRDAAPF
jgi:hypothetical protein